MQQANKYILTALVMVYDSQERWKRYPEEKPVKYLNHKVETLEFSTFKDASAAINTIIKRYRDYHIYDIYDLSSIRIDEYVTDGNLTAKQPVQSWVFKHKDEPLERYSYKDGIFVGEALPYHDGEIVEMVIDDQTIRLAL